ncbi:class I SAM-dependent methyltransferase [Streptosporangium lutulentum]
MVRPTGPGLEASASTSLLHEFLRSPLLTATVAPSSRRLSAQMTVPIPERGEPTIVELGPGTGAFTRFIQDRLGGRGRHLAIELNPRLAGFLGRRFPGVEVVHASAADLLALMAERGLSADVVVSGLPWVAFRRRRACRCCRWWPARCPPAACSPSSPTPGPGGRHPRDGTSVTFTRRSRRSC